MKIILILVGLLIVWRFFHRRTSLLAMYSFEVSNLFIAFAIAISRALIFGYITYLLIAVFGSIGHISTPLQLLEILQARPSDVGGPGVAGVIAGAIIALRAYHGNYTYQRELIQGKRIWTQQVKTKQSMIVRFALRVFKALQ